MKRFAKLLASLSLLSVLNYIRINSTERTVLVVPRVLVLALSPVLLILGLIATLIGWREKSRNIIVSGMIGSFLAAFYIQQATQRHDGFERAFGVGWQDKIDVPQRKYMLRSRYQAFLPIIPQPQIQRDLTYATVEETDLTCDIWQPPAYIKPSGVAMIYCHGSGWYYGWKGRWIDRLFSQLNAQGHVVMDINYRKSYATDGIGIVGDLHRAVAWLKQHADDYGVNPERIVVAGGSAGGHMALMVAYAPDHPQLKPATITTDTSVCGVISYYGITDLRAFHDYGTAHFEVDPTSPLIEISTRMLQHFAPTRNRDEFPLVSQTMAQLVAKGTPDEKPDMYELLSPLHHVHEHCPPTLLLHGEYDLGVPAEQASDLANALREKGCKVIHNELAYTDHGFDLLFTPVNPAFRTALFDVERFLALLR